MARKKQSAFDDLISIATMFPWQVSLMLALVSYFGFHYVSSLPPLPIQIASSNLGQPVSNSIIRQAMVSFAMFMQYLVPLAFLIGAVVSVFRRRRQAELHRQVANMPNRDALERMSWSEFEELTAEVFRRKGYAVAERGGNGPDGGVDLVLHMGKDKYLVQCKQWKTMKVGVATVRELYGVMTAQSAVGGFVVASGAFSDDARRFAEGRSIKLVPTESMLHMVKETSGNPATEPKKTTEPSCPKCGSGMVLRTAKRGELTGSSFWGCSRYPACRGISKC
jgi:restriction system protein